MSRDLSKIIVVDVESTCWEDGNFFPGRTSEIIEIGYSIIDPVSLTIVDNQSIIVKPEKSEVSEFCTNLTGITQEMVDKGISLSLACTRLSHLVRERPWASYGDYDRVQFERECRSKNIKYPFDRTHINVKTLFALKNKIPKEVGMDSALKILKLPLKGKHHRGVDDAYNIAMIFIELLK